MSLNATPRSGRLHISLFGRRNAGKSSIINALTDQDISIVSPVKGTTTDPVYKSMELLPIGPVVIIDTPGLDDEGELGEQRMRRTQAVLNKTDVAIIVAESEEGITGFERELLALIGKKRIPSIIALNKQDQAVSSEGDIAAVAKEFKLPVVAVSAATKLGISELKEALIKQAPEDESQYRIIGDLISPGDVVVLVTPIDSAAPKGRLILPQQQTIRDILDTGALPLVTKETTLPEALGSLKRSPKLVVTDAQAFKVVSELTPDDIPLTSFSMLFARYKGNLEALVDGARSLDTLKDGDRVLIAEGCTHHRQDDDIGTVKLPRWLSKHTGKQLAFETCSGTRYPDNLSDYALILHCGGCMLNRREMVYRVHQAGEAGVPIVNYGVLIAFMQGILPRALNPLGIDF